MKKNNKNHNLEAVLGVIGLYSLTGFAIYLTVSWQNPSFVEAFSTVTLICLLILTFEALEQAVLSTIKWVRPLHFFLVIKELVICFFLSLISLLFAAEIIEFFLGNIPLTRNLFNLLISITFLTSLFLYWIYMLIHVSKHLDNLYMRFIKTGLSSNMSIKVKLNKKMFLNFIDFFAILTTVFLLSNSTAAGIADVSAPSSVEFFESTEFRLLSVAMAVYVLAAYHKLPLKSHY